jgi:hypothetical protein
MLSAAAGCVNDATDEIAWSDDCHRMMKKN